MTEEIRTILYVDDEQSNLDIFTAALRRHYKIITAKSALDAIDLLKSNKIDLIITDQRMPEMTGVQFLESVSPEYPDVIRMILTGFSDVDAIVNAINKGSVFRYITKPWNENELKQIVDTGMKIRSLELSNKALYLNLKEQSEKQKLTIDLFKKYVPTEVVDQVLSDDSVAPSLENEYRNISVLFCDIRGFTSFSENKDPYEIVKFLNDFFVTMSACVTNHNGYVYKYLGDAMLVTFGAPIMSDSNELNAALCAMEMVEALKQFNEGVGKKFQTNFRFGVGIATGGVHVGHISSDKHLIYSIVGKPILDSIAIENETKSHENSIIVDEMTYLKLRNQMEVQPCEPSTSPGLAGMPLFRLIGEK